MNDQAAPPDSPASPTTATAKRRFPWLTVFIFGCGLLAIAGVAAFLAWPRISREWNARQARQLLAKAEAAAQAEEWQEASENYGKAYLKAPTESDVIRAIARFMQKTGSDPERTLAFWRQLMDSGAATAEDRLAMAQTYLRLNKPAEARQMFSTLGKEEQKSKTALEMEAALLNAEGFTAEANTKMREALQMEPDNPDSRLKLAEMDLRSPLSEVQGAAVSQLWEVARADNDSSLAAVDLLARQARLNRDDFNRLLKILAANPKAEPRHRYGVLGQLADRYPEEKETLFAREESELSKETPDHSVPYLLMLQSINEHERVLKLLPMDRVTKLREFFALYAESLAATGQWSVLRDAIQKAPTLPIPPADSSLLRARISKGLNESPNVVRGHLLDAAKHATASRDIRNVRRISAIADSMGYSGAALEVLRSGAALPQHRIAMLETVLRIQTNQQDAEGMLRTLSDILETEPSLQYHLENQLYLKLLLGVEMELLPAAIDAMNTATLSGPAIQPLLKALTAYRFQDIDALRAALKDIEVSQLPPGRRAVLSGLMNVCGDAAKAFQIAERIPRALLLPEEKRFLNLAL